MTYTHKPQSAAPRQENVNSQNADSQSVPVIQETVEVRKAQVETGKVRVSKRTHVDEQPLTIPLESQAVEITRVPKNQVVEQIYPPHQEGDTLIVPVFEEKYIKQLVLKEEVHITVQAESHISQKHVLLRGEEAIVERYDSESGEWKTDSAA